MPFIKLKDITPTMFKAYFVRDFVYGTTIDSIMDSDISKALNEAVRIINRHLIPCKLLYIAFMYLTAHYLVLDVRMGFNGVQSVGQQIVQSNSQGVSESYSIPPRFVNNAVVNAYAKTDYGLRYLSIVLPNMIGHVSSASETNNEGNPNLIAEYPYGFI